MGWERVQKRVAVSARGEANASIRLFTRATAQLPSCRIALKQSVGCDWRTGDAIALLLGGGADAGKLRLVRDVVGTIAKVNALKRGAAVIDLGFVEALGRADRALTPCVATRIDADTVEVVLPAWDDAGADEDIDRPLPANKPASDAPAARSSTPAAVSEPGVQRDGARIVRLHGVVVDLTPNDESVTFRGKTMEVSPRQAQLTVICMRAMPLPVDRTFARQQLFGGRPGADAQLDLVARDLQKALVSIGLNFEAVRGVGFVLRKA